MAVGSLAQLGEHLPYKQRVTGSSPVTPTNNGPVVQVVRTLACHARGRRFEPVPGRQICLWSSVGRAGDWKSPCRWFDSVRRHQKYADVAHLVERHLAKVEVAGSSPVIRSIEKREYQRCSLFSIPSAPNEWRGSKASVKKTCRWHVFRPANKSQVVKLKNA